MLVENQLVEVSWNPKTKSHYLQRGYKFTHLNEKFFVNVVDLPKNSSMNVRVICDYCGKEFLITYQHYNRVIHKEDKISCQKCAGKKVSQKTLNKRQDYIYNKIIEVCKKNKYNLITAKHEILKQDSMISYICPIHGKHSVKAASILEGHLCPKCGRIKSSIKINNATLGERQDNLYKQLQEACKNNGYILISNKGDIKNNTSYIKYHCQLHGVHKMRVSNMINGKKCPDCNTMKNAEKYKLSVDVVSDRIKNLGGIILNIDEYKNSQKNNLQIICKECGNVFFNILQKFYSTRRTGLS